MWPALCRQVYTIVMEKAPTNSSHKLAGIQMNTAVGLYVLKVISKGNSSKHQRISPVTDSEKNGIWFSSLLSDSECLFLNFFAGRSLLSSHGQLLLRGWNLRSQRLTKSGREKCFIFNRWGHQKCFSAPFQLYMASSLVHAARFR